MFVLLTYDIELKDEIGKSRLRKIAKICEKYGIRVQNSVFELKVDNSQLLTLKNELSKTISIDDSIRIYKLGNNYLNKIEILGKEEKIELSSDNSFIF